MVIFRLKPHWAPKIDKGGSYKAIRPIQLGSIDNQEYDNVQFTSFGLHVQGYPYGGAFLCGDCR